MNNSFAKIGADAGENAPDIAKCFDEICQKSPARSAQEAERAARDNAERLKKELEALRATQSAAKETYGTLQDRQGDLERLFRDEAARAKELQQKCQALEVSNEAEAEAASAYRAALEDVSKNMASNVRF